MITIGSKEPKPENTLDAMLYETVALAAGKRDGIEKFGISVDTHNKISQTI